MDGNVIRAMIHSNSVTVFSPEHAEKLLHAQQEAHSIWMLWVAMQNYVAGQAQQFDGHVEEVTDSDLSLGLRIEDGSVVIDRKSCPLAHQLIRWLNSFVAAVAGHALQGSRAPVCVRSLFSEQQKNLQKRFCQVVLCFSFSKTLLVLLYMIAGTATALLVQSSDARGSCKLCICGKLVASQNATSKLCHGTLHWLNALWIQPNGILFSTS